MSFSLDSGYGIIVPADQEGNLKQYVLDVYASNPAKYSEYIWYTETKESLYTVDALEELFNGTLKVQEVYYSDTETSKYLIVAKSTHFVSYDNTGVMAYNDTVISGANITDAERNLLNELASLFNLDLSFCLAHFIY